MSDELRVILTDSDPIELSVSLDENPLNLTITGIDDDNISLDVIMNNDPVNIILTMEESPLTVTYATIAEIGPPGTPAVAEWITYVVGWKTIPTLYQTIDTGRIFLYIFSDFTLYRYIADDLSEDSFYENCVDGVVSGLVITRGM